MKEVDTLIIVGPTASGKTSLSIMLALDNDAEIISADSRAIYKGLDIGTAKPSIKERQGIVHYGLDIVLPNERYSAQQFQEDTKKNIEDIRSKPKLPIIVGGTGLYIDAFVYDFKMPKPDYELRRVLDSKSIDQLQQMIISQNLKMPFNYKNKLHLIHTLERKQDIPSRSRDLPPNYLMVGLSPEKDTLRKNIETRAQQMIYNGVIDETKRVISEYGKDAIALKSGIYKQIVRYLDREIEIDEVITSFIKSDTNLAKRQLTWFRRNKDIIWFEDNRSIIDYLAKNVIFR